MFVSCAELEKAQHAKHQRAVIDSFLEMRIKLQVRIPAGHRMYRARSIPVRASISCNNRNEDDCVSEWLIPRGARDHSGRSCIQTPRAVTLANRPVARTRRTTNPPHSHSNRCLSCALVRRLPRAAVLAFAFAFACRAALRLPWSCRCRRLVFIRSPSLPPQPTD
jgi:hypothetical protein